MARHAAVTERGLVTRSVKRFRKIRAILAGGLVLGTGATLTMAAWTNSQYGTATFSSGTFALQSRTQTGASFANNTSAAPATLQVATGSMVPGDSRIGYLQVRATGTAGGSVALDAVSLAGAPLTGSNLAFANALTVTVSAVADATPTTHGATVSCSASTSGTTVTGISNIPSTPAKVAATLLPNGANTVTFCVVVKLPADAPSAAQGGTVTPTWEFRGTTVSSG